MRENIWPTILIGLILGILVANSSGQVTGQRQCFAEICALQSQPRSYLGIATEIRALYVAGFEMGWLEAVAPCRAGNQSNGIRYLFDTNFEENTAKKTYKQFQNRLKRRAVTGELAKIPGTYQVRVEPYEKANPTDARFEFQVRILKVISVQ